MSAQTITNASELDRRQLLTAAGGLLLAFTLEGGGRAALAAGTTAPTGFPGFIHIAPDGSVTVFVGGGEMGQGIYSGLAQCAAEERSRTAPYPGPYSESILQVARPDTPDQARGRIRRA